eukprot:GHVL01032523.1.p1 GENE.GHVL01032523.1~~GHVL01032523.1.p1  ORF type:complete len:715 (-),score=129.61 GHVL01032523.1:10-2154(-)
MISNINFVNKKSFIHGILSKYITIRSFSNIRNRIKYKPKLKNKNDIGYDGLFLSKNFKEMEIHPAIIEALEIQGILNPTHIQYESIKPLTQGLDCVLASETGSGKSLAYILPLISRLYYKHDELTKKRNNSIPSLNPLSRLRPWVVVVLNKDLIAQLCSMCRSLDPRGILQMQTLEDDIDEFPHVNAWSSPFRDTRNVATSHSLITRKRPTITAQRIRWGVADIVVTTATTFLRDLERFKGDQIYPETLIFDEIDMLWHASNTPRLMDIIGNLRPRLRIPEKSNRTQPLPPAIPTQFVFVGATLAAIGSYSIMPVILKRFPLSLHIVAPTHHKYIPTITDRWICVKPHFDDRLEALLIALRSQEASRTLVFVPSSEEEEKIYKMLSDKGWPIALWNKGKENRSQIVTDFSTGTHPILVLSDYGARGVDWWNVDHVINFRFSKDITNYLHRRGRTGRGGKKGVVTNFYDETNVSEKRLVDLIKQSVANDDMYDNIFSRKQSLNMKYKRKNKKNIERYEENEENSSNEYSVDLDRLDELVGDSKKLTSLLQERKKPKTDGEIGYIDIEVSVESSDDEEHYGPNTLNITKPKVIKQMNLGQNQFEVYNALRERLIREDDDLPIWNNLIVTAPPRRQQQALDDDGPIPIRTMPRPSDCFSASGARTFDKQPFDNRRRRSSRQPIATIPRPKDGATANAVKNSLRNWPEFNDADSVKLM